MGHIGSFEWGWRGWLNRHVEKYLECRAWGWGGVYKESEYLADIQVVTITPICVAFIVHLVHSLVFSFCLWWGSNLRLADTEVAVCSWFVCDSEKIRGGGPRSLVFRLKVYPREEAERVLTNIDCLLWARCFISIISLNSPQRLVMVSLFYGLGRTEFWRIMVLICHRSPRD